MSYLDIHELDLIRLNCFKSFHFTGSDSELLRLKTLYKEQSKKLKRLYTQNRRLEIRYKYYSNLKRIQERENDKNVQINNQEQVNNEEQLNDEEQDNNEELNDGEHLNDEEIINLEEQTSNETM